jgi:hypothetical protein
MDVAARVAPEALVGRAVRIYWELDDAWFLGEIIGGRGGSGSLHCWLHRGCAVAAPRTRPTTNQPTNQPKPTTESNQTQPAWDPVSTQHTLRYQDGDDGHIWVGVERIRLAFSCGEALAPPTADQLLRLAACYTRWGAAVAAARAARRGGGEEGEDIVDESGRVVGPAPGSDEWVSPLVLVANRGCCSWPIMRA